MFGCLFVFFSGDLCMNYFRCWGGKDNICRCTFPKFPTFPNQVITLHIYVYIFVVFHSKSRLNSLHVPLKPVQNKKWTAHSTSPLQFKQHFLGFQQESAQNYFCITWETSVCLHLHFQHILFSVCKCNSKSFTGATFIHIQENHKEADIQV